MALKLFLSLLIVLVSTAHQSCLCHNLQQAQPENANQANIVVDAGSHSCCKSEAPKTVAQPMPGGCSHSASSNIQNFHGNAAGSHSLSTSHKCCRSNNQAISLSSPVSNDYNLKVTISQLPSLSQSIVMPVVTNTNNLFARFGP
ncbi:MAG: hypothetical protein K2Q33_05410 [Gammaproteobacteria bacterium]|nr:hypothetical protein [Gammaproteobacteria bacterium]